MDQQELKELTLEAIKASLRAGEKILEVYESDHQVEEKNDKSPLTLADKQSHNVIDKRLQATGLPILSEEGKDIPYEERSRWPRFWLVDPLDGTKEFIKRNGEFTVNIALVEVGEVIAGVIYVPVKDILYFSLRGIGSFKLENVKDHRSAPLEEMMEAARKLPADQGRNNFTVVASRSHINEDTQQFIQELEKEHGEVETTSVGSSLKLCLVAEGAADIYPRFGPTMEWDTAAGQSIALEAGKEVIDQETGERLQYNKEDLLNHWFIVK